MFTNPYDDEQRKAVIKQLGATSPSVPGQDVSPTAAPMPPPTSNTMPVTPGPSVLPVDPNLAGDALPPKAITPFPSDFKPGGKFPGSAPKYAMEGFNFDREQDTAKSAKDAFAYLSNQAPPPPINDKNALGQWFEKYIRPGMDALGHKVSSVNGDTFTYGNHEGNFTVDYGRGAGAEGGALAWQATPADEETAARYGTPSTQTGSAAPTAPADPTAAGGLGNEDAMAQIMAELQAIVRGGQSPAQRRAVISHLGNAS